MSKTGGIEMPSFFNDFKVNPSEGETAVIEEEEVIIDEVKDDEDDDVKEVDNPDPKSKKKDEDEIDEKVKEEEEVETIDEETQEEEETVKDDEEVSEGTFVNFMEHLTEEGVVTPDPEKEYLDSSEGLEEVIKDTISVGIEDYKNTLGQESLEIITWLEDGGSLNEFLEVKAGTNYSDVDVNDPRSQEGLILDLFEHQDYTDEEAQEKLDEYIENGTIEKHAKVAYGKLVSIQEKEDTNRKAKMKSDQEAEAKQESETLHNMEETILNTEELHGFKPSKAERQKLRDFIFKPDRRGVTEFSKVDTFENRIFTAYLLMKKFNYSDAVKDGETISTIKIKKKISNFTDSNATRKKGVVNESTPDPETPVIHWVHS